MKLELSITIDLLKLTPKTRKRVQGAIEAAAKENATVAPADAPPPDCGPGEPNCKG